MIIESNSSKQIIYRISGRLELDKIIELVNILINSYFSKLLDFCDVYFSSRQNHLIEPALTSLRKLLRFDLTMANELNHYIVIPS